MLIEPKSGHSFSELLTIIIINNDATSAFIVSVYLSGNKVKIRVNKYINKIKGDNIIYMLDFNILNYYFVY